MHHRPLIMIIRRCHYYLDEYESAPAQEVDYFIRLTLTSSRVNLLLFRSHHEEMIMLKRLIQERNNVTKVRFEPCIMQSEQ